jgi:hypothetical protein
VNTRPSPTFGTVRAAGGQDTAEWLLTRVIPRLRGYAKKHGEAQDDGTYLLRLSMSDLLGETFGCGGSRVRVQQVLQHLKILKLKKHAISGQVAKKIGKHPSIWAIDVRTHFDRRQVDEALLTVAIRVEQGRLNRAQQRSREARLAGEYGEETTGTALEHHHEHIDYLIHPHPELGDEEVPHYHEVRDGPPIPMNGDESAVDTEEAHVRQVEYRHHTHVRRERPSTEAWRPVLRDDLLGNKGGGHPAVVVVPEKDQLYREVVDINRDLEAQLARRTAECERKDERIAELLEEIKRLEAQLHPKIDPSEVEARDIVERHRKGA